MNEEYIKEYEEMSLCDFADELVEPLSAIKQDLAKIIYIHYAEERDKYEELQQRIEKVIEYIDSESPDAGVSGHHIKKILKGEESNGIKRKIYE